MFSMMKFEDVAHAYYADQDYSKRVLTHPDNEELKEKVTNNHQKAKNPFMDAYIWIKGEFLDVNGMFKCLKGREDVMKSMKNLEDKKKSDENEAAKIG